MMVDAKPRVINEAMRQSIKSIAALLDLENGWDSYGAGPIDPVIVAQAICWVVKMLLPDTPPCQATPCSDGSLQLEWHQNGVDLEIYFSNGNATYVAVLLMDNGDAHEGRATKHFISPWLKALTARMDKV